MKGTLTFKLPEEKYEFKLAQNGSAYIGVLQNYDNYLRNRLKYEDLPKPVAEALQAARDHLYDILNDYSLTLFE